MTELGTRLKEARIAKGYTIDDLQQITKIQKHHLLAIEDGDYSRLPGAFYVKAHIRQYADAVGLDGKVLLQEYASELPETNHQVPSGLQTGDEKKRFTVPFGGLGESLPKVLVVLLIFLSLVVIWVSLQSRQNPENVEESEETGVKYEAPAEVPASSSDTAGTEESRDQQDEADQKEPAEAPEQEAQSSLTVESVSGEDTFYTWKGPETRKLVIEAEDRSWIRMVDEDGSEIMSREMKPDEHEEIDVSDVQQVRLRIGATQAVSVSLNETPISYEQDRVTQNLIIRFGDAE